MPEQIWLLLLFLLIVLFNLVAGLLKPRRKRDAAGEEKKGPHAVGDDVDQLFPIVAMPSRVQ